MKGKVGLGAPLAALLVLACAPSAPDTRPDLLLVVVDTLRADHVGSYGYPLPTTPHMDALAAEGVRFQVAYAPMGTTTPAHAALFTSREPLDLGLLRNGLALPRETETLAEIAARGGYRTAAFVSSYPVSRRFGLDRGFETFDDRFDRLTSRVRDPVWEGVKVEGGFDRSGEATVDAALRWLEESATGSDAPIFLWLHLFDPHGPHTGPSPFEELFPSAGATPRDRLAARYDAAIRQADEQIGRLLAGVAAARDPRRRLTVVTADHGEGLFDHGWAHHNRFTYEEEVRVPLIFHAPWLVAGPRRADQPARLVDLLPTLASLLDLPGEDTGRSGIDLSPWIRGEADPDPTRPIFAMRPYHGLTAPRPGGPGLGFALRVGVWKYQEASEPPLRELYRLDRDPGERRNLVAQAPERSREMATRLRAWLERRAFALAPSDLGPEERAALEALGYGDRGGASAATGSPSSRRKE